MAIDVREEKLIALLSVPKLPWLSKSPTAPTVIRWAKVGLASKDGQTVKLETIQEGGRLATSEAAVLRFFERLAADRSAPRTPSQAARAKTRADALLDAAGI